MNDKQVKTNLESAGSLSVIGEGLGSLPGRYKDLLSVLLLSLLPVIFLANVLLTDQVLVGDNLATELPWRAYASEELLQRPTNQRTDPLYSYYPRRVIAAGIVRSGNLPLWNPYYLAGVPLLATAPGAGFLYPPNIIYYVVNPLRGFGLSACLHLVLAGVFMYLYLRSIQLDRISSLFGAVSFQLSGYFLVNLMWLMRVSTAAWAPFIFFCFEKYWREKRGLYAILLAFGVGMCILAGLLAGFVYIMLGFGLYLTLRFFLTAREQSLKEAAKSMAVITAAVGLGVLLAAVQLIPTYEASRSSERAYLSYGDMPDTGRSPLSLATALVPDIFGNPVDATWVAWDRPPRNYLGKGIPANYADPNVYTGILPLLLAVWAVVFKRNRYVLFFAGLAVLSLSLFLNLPSVVSGILYIIPLFRVGRLVEVKVTYAFALCVLAAWGFSSLLQQARRQSRSRMRRASPILLAMGMTGLVGLIIAWGIGDASGFPQEWYPYNIPNFVRFGLLVLACAVVLLLRVREKMGAHLYGVSAIMLVVVDMFHFGWKFNPPQRAADLYLETDSIRFLRADGDLFRVMRGPRGRIVLPPNTPAAYGISDAQGYTSLMLDYYEDFIELIEPEIGLGMRKIWHLREVQSLSSKLLDVLNVKYILTVAETNEHLLWFDERHEDIDLVYDGEIKIYENRDVLPRAFMVHDFKVVPDREGIFEELTSEEFDPGAYVVLQEEPSTDPAATHVSASNSTARILDYASNKVVIEVDAADDGFLVLSDLYYEGWKALVDGESQRVYRADYILRAVQLTEGQHTVEFIFDPSSFKLGLCVSGTTVIVMCTLLIFSFVRGHDRWNRHAE